MVGRKKDRDPGPPLAAGASLQQMRRRVWLGRAGLWAALAAGPAALLVSLASPTTTAPPAAAPVHAVGSSHKQTADPSGYAAVFLQAWLRSDAGQDSAQARVAQSMAPDVDLPEPAADAQSAVERTTAVRGAQLSGDRWSVTVAAQSARGGVAYFAVPVTVRATGAVVVTGAPAQVAAPVTGPAVSSAYTVSVPDSGELTSTVGQFLGAYLAGQGRVDRYLAPRVRMSGVSPAPYRSVEVQEVAGQEDSAGDAGVPADGSRVHVVVHVQATSASGRWPLAYELALSARAGRWEVAALSSGGGQ
ncbi:conjugal transfer protein [Streptomyces sp. NPDC051320]|uniref:conjugal transfer protein n=1 Tax=Streptomyces sp. NPDC051320 TaxID=3154644 RepID=UPI00343791BF